MKTLLKLTSGMVLALIIASSCQKEKTASVEIPKEKISLTELVQKMYAPSNASTDVSFKTAYASLSPEELQQFEILRLQHDSLQLTEKASDGPNGKVSVSQQVSISAQLRMTKDLRSSIYTAALSKFNKQFNKLSSKEQDELFSSLEHKKSDPITTFACTVATYPSSAPFTTNGGIGYYGIYNMTAQGQTDCDYEYRFDGWYDYVKGVDNASRWCLESFGDRVSRRIYYYNDGVDTFLLIGAGRVNFWCGPASYLRIQMS